MQFAGQLTPEEFWATVDAGDDEVRRTFAERPVYGVVGWSGPAMLSEWSFGDGIRSLAFRPADGIPSVDLAVDRGPGVDVLVDVAEPRRLVALRLARDAMAGAGVPPWPMPDAPPPDLIVDLVVDGIAEPFELWERDSRARAAGRVGSVTVVVEAVDLPIGNLALERVTDIEPLIAERRRWLRELRGE
ncbi:hypothetical protein [Agromyces bauzanensis]